MKAMIDRVREKGKGKRDRSTEATDITERPHAEEQACAAQVETQRLLANFPVAVIVVDALTRTIESVNARAATMFGGAAEQMVGHRCHSFICPAEENGCQELDLGQGVNDSEGVMLLANGSRCPVLKSVIRIQLRGREKLLECFVDLRERKRTEEALRFKNFVFDAAIAANSIADLSGNITEANEAFLRVWRYSSKKEVVGKSIQHFLNDPNEAAAIVTALNSTGQWAGDYTARRKDGSTFIAHGMATTVKDEKGRVVGYQSAVNDVTGQREAEKELERHRDHLEQLVAERTADLSTRSSELDAANMELRAANHLMKTQNRHLEAIERQLKSRNIELELSNKDLEQFAHSASHDLQEPLRKVVAFGSLLMEQCGEKLPDEGCQYVEYMREATQRMQGLISDLLTYSRVATRGHAFFTVDLNHTLRDVLSDLELCIRETRATLEVGPLPTIEADPTQMRQLFQNLIGNALKFVKPGVPPLVSVRADTLPPATGDGRSAPCAMWRIVVEDNGIGFEQKYAERIFGVFQRLHQRQEYQGSGIGLAVCRRVAERHGGTITAEGRPGAGATFIIRLPTKHGDNKGEE